MGEAKEHKVGDFVPGKGLEMVDSLRKDLEGLRFRVELADGKTIEGTTKKDGIISIPADADGDVKITILLENDADSQEDQEEDENNEQSRV